MKTRGRPSRARELILQAATDLFFMNGFQATGVSDIIAHAGVSKPTFYSHFPSKDELCIAYLQTKRTSDLEQMRDAIRVEKDPYQRFFVPFEILRSTQVKSGFRGCAYFNMLSEMGQQLPEIKSEVKFMYDSFSALFRDLTVELIESTSEFNNCVPENIVQLYSLTFGGATMLSQEYETEHPIDIAKQQMENALCRN